MNCSSKRIGVPSILGMTGFYIAAILLGDMLSAQIGIAKSYTALLAVLFGVATIICLYANGHELPSHVALFSTEWSSQRWYTIAFCVFAFTGLFSGSGYKFSAMETALCLVCACCMAIVEEVLFRGLLLRALIEKKNDPLAAILISGATFGVWEVVGLFSGDSFLATIFLLVCDVAVGAALSAFALRTKNLVPCIVCHAVRNVLCIFGITSLSFRICGGVIVITTAVLFTRNILALNRSN